MSGGGDWQSKSIFETDRVSFAIPNVFPVTLLIDLSNALFQAARRQISELRCVILIFVYSQESNPSVVSDVHCLNTLVVVQSF